MSRVLIKLIATEGPGESDGHTCGVLGAYTNFFKKCQRLQGKMQSSFRINPLLSPCQSHHYHGCLICALFPDNLNST